MMYAEDDLLPLSGLQHVLFCERQFALIHVERGWEENRFTAEGRILHNRAHSQGVERRPGIRTERGMAIRSLELGVAGVADVVEIRADGVICPVEYKRGRRKQGSMDEVQLCAQAMCIEEMLATRIAEGALFYGKERRRKIVLFDDDLRAMTRSAAARAHEIADSWLTPPPVYTKQCRRCSFYEGCMPAFLSKHHDVERYLSRMADSPISDPEEGS